MSTFSIFDRKTGRVINRDGKPTDDDDDIRRPSIVVGGPSPYGNPSVRQVYTPNDYETQNLRRRAEDAERALKKLGEQPTIVGVVVELCKHRDAMVVGLGPGGVFEIKRIEGAKVGHRVLLLRDTLQAISCDEPEVDTPCAGSIVHVEEVGDFHITAKLGPELRAFRCMLGTSRGDDLASPSAGSVAGANRKVKVGDRVALDPSMSYVVSDLGPPPSPLTYPPKIRVAWDEIGGQADAKQALRDAIELPAEHPELFASYGKRPSKGVLLAGPPGTGKTMLAKAAATSLAKINGESHASGFVYVKGPELLSGWIGRTEQAIREVFAGAREHRRKHDYPCVVFIDECEALLKRRGEGGPHFDIAATVVPQFLAEMDGMDESAALFILATNRIDMIDPAVLRDGRIDRRVHVGRPSKDDIAPIAMIHLAHVPCHGIGDTTDDERKECIAAHISDEMWRDDRILWAGEPLGHPVSLRLRDLASGALVMGIVDQATTSALRRDAGKKRKTPQGVRAEDVTEAIDRKCAELARQDHREAIAELLARDRAAVA